MNYLFTFIIIQEQKLSDRNNTQWKIMDSMLSNNGNKEQLSAGFQKGTPGHPNKNPYEMDTGKDKEDLTWLLG